MRWIKCHRPGLDFWSLLAAVAAALAIGWACWGLACSPAQLAETKAVATAVGPTLAADCALAVDTGPAAPYLDLLCVGAEAADAALQRLPAGTAAIVAASAAPPPAAPAMSVYRLRVLLHSFPTPVARLAIPTGSPDAGGGR